MNLFLIHCGFYDHELTQGVYEFHVNIPVVAENLEEAKKKVRLESAFIAKKMHIDGIQELKTVSGYHIKVEPDESSTIQTDIRTHLHRDL
jgi:hypothetical protein